MPVLFAVNLLLSVLEKAAQTTDSMVSVRLAEKLKGFAGFPRESFLVIRVVYQSILDRAKHIKWRLRTLDCLLHFEKLFFEGLYGFLVA